MSTARDEAVPWLQVLGTFTVLGLISAGAATGFQRLEAQPASMLRNVVTVLPTWWFWALVTKPIFHLARRFPIGGARWLGHLALHLGFATGFVLIQTTFTVTLSRLFFAPTSPDDPWLRWFAGFLSNRGVWSLLVYGGLAGLAHALDARNQLRRRELDRARLETELTRARLEALQQQLEPHFLFNTLHAVGVLNQEDPAKATRMIASLGDLLRASLANKSSQEITLGQEFALLGHYLDIESIRFADRLSVAVAVPPDLTGYLVPPFLLQPLVENAVRHGVAARPGPSQIRIHGSRHGTELELSVWNDGGGVAPNGRSEGLGLANIRDRLARLYGPTAGCILEERDGGVQAIVRLPLHDVPVLSPGESSPGPPPRT